LQPSRRLDVKYSSAFGFGWSFQTGKPQWSDFDYSSVCEFAGL